MRLAVQGEHQRERVLGHRGGGIRGYAQHPQPQPARGVEVNVVEAGAAQGDSAHAACREGLEHGRGKVVVHESTDGLRPGRERGGAHVQPGFERQCVDPRFAQGAVQRIGLVSTVRVHGDAHGSVPFPSMPHPDAGPPPGV